MARKPRKVNDSSDLQHVDDSFMPTPGMAPFDDEEEAEEGPDFDAEQEVIETEDGGAIVRFGDEDEEDVEAEGEFYRNLADGDLEPLYLNRMATSLLDLISKDREARKKRDEQYAEGLKRTGLGNDAPGGAEFEGASRVVHPMLVEACVDFAARAMKELFPPVGPVKSKVEGDVTPEKLEKAERKTRTMNWQLAVQSPSFRSELEQLLTQVPMGGGQYLQVTWREDRNRPDFTFVGIDDIYLPYAATNFYSAARKTHVEYLTEVDYRQRVRSGQYRDVDLAPLSMEPDQTEAEQANQKIEGKEETSYNEDGLRTIYNCYALMDVEKEGEFRPYIIVLDKVTSSVLAVYRNWMEDDPSYEELQWLVEFPFIPWRGAYPIGLTHLIGGLSGAATGALRALLDSAHINNQASMVKLKGSTGGQSVSIQPTQVAELEGGLNVDDIRKLAMPIPFNPPSPVLYELLGFLVNAGRGVVQTSMETLSDSNPNMPVGTTLALIEQGMVVYSSIHARLHDAVARVLRILHRLNALYLDDIDVEEEVGEGMATKEDFQGPLDVVPVSDPNIFSEAQRFAQIQAVAQRSQLLPGVYNVRKVEERILKTLRIPDPDELLVPTSEPENQNAISENVAASLGRSIVAFPEQDHIAHLKAHLSYMLNPMLGSSPMMAGTCLPVLLNHLKEHVALWYMQRAYNLAEESLGIEDLDDMLKDHEDDADNRGLDRLLAETGLITAQQAQQIFAQLPEAISQAQKLMQQYQGPPPVDPATIEQKKIDQKAQSDQMGLQLKAQDSERRERIEMAKLSAANDRDQQKAILEQMIAQLGEEHEDARLLRRIAADLQMNEADNMTALSLAQQELASGEKFSVSTGTGINPGA